MKVEIKVGVKLRLIEVEPDGAECTICGDCCYLSQSEIWAQFTIAGNKNKPKKLDFAFCQSCRDQAKEIL